MDKVPAYEAPENKRLVSAFEQMHLQDVFAEPEKRQEFLQNTDYSDFEKWITWANGAARNAPKLERGFAKVSVAIVDEDNRNEIDYLPPPLHVKQHLMYSVFEAAQEVDDLKESAMLIGLSINLIHPFRDGNGRTSRLAYSLLAKGYDGTDDAKAYYNELLKNGDGRNMVHLDSSKIRDKFTTPLTEDLFKKVSGDEQPKGVVMPKGSWAELGIDVDVYRDINWLNQNLREPKFGLPLALAWIAETDRCVDDYIEMSKGEKCLSAAKVLTDIDGDDLNHLMRIQTKHKVNYIKSLIGCFKNGHSKDFGSAQEIMDIYDNDTSLKRLAQGALWAANKS